MIERDADDVAALLRARAGAARAGLRAGVRGRGRGLISAGAFVAFVRRRGRAPAQARPARASRMRRSGDEAAPSPRRAAARAVRGDAAGAAHAQRLGRPREWWELNEQGTILRGERTGATLRLGDRVEVRVARVDAIRGRVDLTPAPDADR